MTEQNTRAGILLMVAAVLMFSLQDALSRALATEYNVWMIVMIRYWVAAVFVVLVALRRPGGIAGVARTRQPGLQALRGLILASEICMAVLSFSIVGLVAHHALFSAVPLIVVALSGPLLGEKVGWRRWSAVAIGAAGVLVILQPGPQMFGLNAALPLGSALLFAVYGILNRYVARQDSPETSFFWTMLIGAAFMSLVGMWFWVPMDLWGWGRMAVLSCTAIIGHSIYIRAFAVAEASAIQPLAYLHLPFAGSLGILVFGDMLDAPLVIGSVMIVIAGLWSWWRERSQAAAHSS